MTPYQKKQLDPTPQKKYIAFDVDRFKLDGANLSEAIAYLQELREVHGDDAQINIDAYEEYDSYCVDITGSVMRTETLDEADMRVRTAKKTAETTKYRELEQLKRLQNKYNTSKEG